MWTIRLSKNQNSSKPILRCPTPAKKGKSGQSTLKHFLRKISVNIKYNKVCIVIDLHTHSIFSDGVLIPSELVRRAESAGLTGIGITDHGDSSNIDFIIPRIVAIARELNRVMNVTVIPGIEITNVPPDFIEKTTGKARALGAKIIVVHGETLLDSVAPGTDRKSVV